MQTVRGVARNHGEGEVRCMGSEIDFVVTWVDGSDPAWRADRAKYEGGSGVDNREERYRDWGLLRYWFRSVEQFAPWVRTVHFVTYGHLPSWLNLDHPKLHVVRHEDYIPKQFLPTFNANVIEMYLHQIPGLSEQFVNFNDDVYLTRPAKPEDFFQDGKPRDMLALQPVVANPQNPVMSHLYLNNSLVLCRHFDKRENMRKQPGAYFKLGYPLMYFAYNMLETMFPKFTGFYSVHGPMPFLRGTFAEIWEKEGDLLEELSKNRFRSETDISSYLFREWQKLAGNFVPTNVQKGFRYFEIPADGEKLEMVLRGQKALSICVNDGEVEGDFLRAKAEIEGIFQRAFPKASSFEKG